MKTQQFYLGDLIHIKHGYAFNGKNITDKDNGVVLITPGNSRIGGGFQEDKCKFFNGKIPDEYRLISGDFIVTMTDLSKATDTLGYSAYVPTTSRTYLHNQRIGLVSLISDECDRGYLYWLMRTYDYQRTIANTATGAAIKHTSPSKIYDYVFSAPNIDTQRRIADILSAYDDLIENNQKQIKILEEAAMRLYKEWFVNLRFPGYENTPVVNGVPEGWKYSPLKEHINVNSHSITKSYKYEHIQYIDISSVNKGRIESKTDYSRNEARGVRSRTTENQVVSDGSPRGDFYRKQLLFSFKKRNKQSAYGTGMAGNKVKCDGGHTTVNVWI